MLECDNCYDEEIVVLIVCYSFKGMENIIVWHEFVGDAQLGEQWRSSDLQGSVI